MDALTLEEVRHTERHYGASLADQFAQQDSIEELAAEAIEDSKQFSQIMSEYVDFEVLTATCRAIYQAVENGNGDSVRVLAVSLRNTIFASAIKREMTA